MSNFEPPRKLSTNPLSIPFQTDTEGYLTFLDESWTENLGYTIPESLGFPLIQFIHQSDRESFHHNSAQNINLCFHNAKGELVELQLSSCFNPHRGLFGFLQVSDKYFSREASIRALYEVTAAQDMSFDERLQRLLEMGCQWFELDCAILAKIEANSLEVLASRTLPTSQLQLVPGTNFDLSQPQCCFLQTP